MPIRYLNRDVRQAFEHKSGIWSRVVDWQYKFQSHYYIDGILKKSLHETAEGRVYREKKYSRVELWNTAMIRGQMHEEGQAKETKNEWPGRKEQCGFWKPGDNIISRAERLIIYACQMLQTVQ